MASNCYAWPRLLTVWCMIISDLAPDNIHARASNPVLRQPRHNTFPAFVSLFKIIFKKPRCLPRRNWLCLLLKLIRRKENDGWLNSTKGERKWMWSHKIWSYHTLLWQCIWKTRKKCKGERILWKDLNICDNDSVKYVLYLYVFWHVLQLKSFLFLSTYLL